MDSNPAFLQGIFSFSGQGYNKQVELPEAVYLVPEDRRAQLIYFRAGQSSKEMVTLILLRDGEQMRLFPLGPKCAMHVPLAVTEDLMPDTKIEIRVAAPEDTSGTIIVDLGFMEIF